MAKRTLILLGFLIWITACNTHNSDSIHTHKYWVWMSMNHKKSESKLDSTFTNLKTMGIDGILLSASPEITQYLLPFAQKHHLEVSSWIWTLNRGDAPKEVLSVNALGNSLVQQKAYVDYYKFMCPGHPESLKHIENVFDSYLKINGLESIHMDYIRYVDAILPIGLQPKYGLQQDSVFAKFDYGYHPIMLKKFQDKYGYNPTSKKDFMKDSLWINFRLETLNHFVDELTKYVHKHGKSISVAVFPSPKMSKTMVRQDWGNWNLDAYFPMIYHNFYNKKPHWIGEIMKQNRKAHPEAKIYCGVYLPALRNEKELQSALEAALLNGANGISFFDFNALNPQQMVFIKKFIEQNR